MSTYNFVLFVCGEISAKVSSRVMDQAKSLLIGGIRFICLGASIIIQQSRA